MRQMFDFFCYFSYSKKPAKSCCSLSKMRKTITDKRLNDKQNTFRGGNY